MFSQDRVNLKKPSLEEVSQPVLFETFHGAKIQKAEFFLHHLLFRAAKAYVIADKTNFHPAFHSVDCEVVESLLPLLSYL